MCSVHEQSLRSIFTYSPFELGRDEKVVVILSKYTSELKKKIIIAEITKSNFTK